MKAIFKNTKIHLQYQIVDVVTFNLQYADILNYNLNNDVNLLYTGNIYTGDVVELDFDYGNNTASHSVVLYTKKNGSYGDGNGLSAMRLTVGSDKVTATATNDCANIKLFFSDKTVLLGSNFETHGFVGKVTIKRAVQP